MNDNFIDKALDEAKKAYLINDVPVGAVIVKDGKIISSAHNYRKNNNALNHAEILAIKKAEEMIGDWRLYDCEMYVTLEPCPMCAGAILLSRIKKVYIGTSSNVKSNKAIINNIFNNSEYYHLVDVEYMNNRKCSQILSSFFANKR